VTSFAKELESLMTSGDQLPTLPHVVFELHGVLNNENAGQGDIAAVIERDPALTARLLRAANSAAFSRGPEHRVASVLGAIQRLGISQVQALCTVLAVVNAFGGKRRGLSHSALWTHSAAVGMVAKLMWARSRGHGPLTPDDLYVAGLLHDVGLLVLDQFLPTYYDQVAAEATLALVAGPRPLHRIELEVLGLEHGEIGGRLLAHWGLPPAVAEAVRWHHRAAEAPEENRRACEIVAAAETICSGQGLGLTEEGPPVLGAEEALAAIGMPESLAEELLLELEPVGAAAASVIG
jgi:HD-like signal output (HDOD) protein